MVVDKIESLVFDAGRDFAAAQAAGNSFNYNVPGSDFFLHMVKAWEFPPIVNTPQKALTFIDGYRSWYPPEAPIQDAVSSAVLYLREQMGLPI